MSAYPARIDYPGQVARALQGKIFFPPDPGFDEARLGVSSPRPIRPMS